MKQVQMIPLFRNGHPSAGDFSAINFAVSVLRQRQKLSNPGPHIQERPGLSGRLNLAQSATPQALSGAQLLQPGIVFAWLGVKTDQRVNGGARVIEDITAGTALRDVAHGIQCAKPRAVTNATLLE